MRLRHRQYTVIVKYTENVEVNKQCKKEEKILSKFCSHSLQIFKSRDSFHTGLAILPVFTGSTLLDISKQEVLFHMTSCTPCRNPCNMPSDPQAYMSDLCMAYEVFLSELLIHMQTIFHTTLQGRQWRTGFRSKAGTRRPVQSAHLHACFDRSTLAWKLAFLAKLALSQM